MATTPISVRNAETNDKLPGAPSPELVEASEAAGDTGIVSAYRDSDGVWQHVPASEVEHYVRDLRENVVTVYVD